MRFRVVAFLTLLVFVAALPAPAHAGDLVITEVAANPALPEPAAEFVVVDNVGVEPVLLDGSRLTDAARAVRGVVPPNTSLDPGQRIALQPAGGAGAYSCSPVPHRALLTAWAGLNNAGDAVVLEAPDGTEVDRVAYPRDAFAADGPSRRIDPAFRTTAGNDDFARWATGPASASPCSLPGPRPGTVRLAPASLSVPESMGAAIFDVRRSGGTNGRVAVPWFTVDGSAAAGSDYMAASGTAVLPAAADRTSVAVPLIGDGRDEVAERFAVQLGVPSGGATLGDPARATVVLDDDDDPPAPAPPVAIPTPVIGGGAGTASGGAGGGGLFSGSAPTPLFGPAAGSAPAPSSGPMPATVPTPAPVPPGVPRATLAVAAWQRVLSRRGITAAIACDRDCTVRVAGHIALGRGRVIELAGTTRTLRAQDRAVVVLPVPRRAARPLRRALRRRGSLRATVAATPSGGVAAERGAKVR
jgi:hypothetical protein